MEKTITKSKRFVSLLVALIMLISLVPSVFANPAEQFSDFPTGWSSPAMKAAVDNGLLVGVGAGEIGPQKNLTRAEMASVMVRAFGATTYADVSMYTDLAQGDWYYNDVARAVRMGALTGVSATEMAPEEYITREQVFSILSRILALSSNNTDALSKFKDAGSVSPWALNTVIPLVERGYVNGDNNGKLNPQSYITREEFAQLMYTTIKVYITQPGTFTEDLSGIVVLRTGNVTLKDMYIEGDLVVGDGAGMNAVNLDGVTVNGRLLTRGGTNYLKATDINYGVVVLNPNGTTYFRNYRTEEPFKGIIEYTVASFLVPGGTSSGTSSGGVKKHDVIFKLFESDDEAYASIKVYDGKKIGNKKMPADPMVPGYTFNGWIDEDGNLVDENTRVYDDMTVVADLTPIVTPPPTPVTYEVVFKLFTGDTTPYATITVEEGEAIGTQMPADPTVAGYTFNGWVDENGNPVTDATIVTGAMTVVADLEAIVTPPTPVFYEVIFKLFAGDTTAYATITVEEGEAIGTQMPANPTVTGYTFKGWVDENGNPVTSATIVVGAMTVVADLEAIVTPPETITVTFWEGLSGRFATQIGEVELELINGEASVPVDQIPDISIYTWEGVLKSDYMDNDYADYNGGLYVSPTFWYYDNGEWKKFDETVVLTQDTEVNLFYNYIGLTGFETAVSTRYSDNTRLIDSIVSLSDDLVEQLVVAKDTGLDIYENINSLLFGFLEDKDLIDENKNIKIIDIQIPISKVTTKPVANGMIKKYVREMITDPAKLDQLLQMVDINELVSYIDQDAFISGLTDEQIVQIITKPENRDDVVDFVIADLQNSESALIDSVLAYVSDALAGDADLRNAVAADFKTKIAGDDETAKKLRKLVLKSGSLESILENDNIKDSVVELIIDVDNGVIDEILNSASVDVKKEIIEEISHYSTFISEIVTTSSFKDYALGLIRLGGSEYDEVTLRLLNSDTAKREILDAVEESDELKTLLKNNATIRADIINSIEIDEEKLLEYIFDIDGAVDYSDIVSKAYIESYFETIPAYALCTTPAQKKQFKNDLYYNVPSAHDEALLEVQSEIADYKEKVLDDFADGTLTNDTIITMIEAKMIEYVRAYLDRTTLNANLSNIIEEHILDYVAKFITNPAPADSELAAVKVRLDADMEEFIATAHENDTVLTAIKNFVKNHHDTEMKEHIANVYEDMCPVLADYIADLDETSNIYVTLDGALKSAAATISSTVIADIIKDKSGDADILELLKAYIQDDDNADMIEDYVVDFIDTIDEAFVLANRNIINSILQRLDLDGFISSNPSDAVQFVKDYIATLDEDEKIVFADDIFYMVSSTAEYINLMNNLFDDDRLEITPENITMLKVLSLTIRSLEMDSALAFTNNSYFKKIIDLMGDSFVEEQFVTVRDAYCDGLDEKIELVENGTASRETYTTALVFSVNPIDTLKKAYEKAQPKLVERLEGLNIHYADNPYLHYLVNHDIIDRLVDGNGIPSGNLTGYKLRDITDYAEYMVELEIAVNDALLWYGDLTENEFNAIYDAVFAKIYAASDKLDGILEDYYYNDELPEKVEKAITSIKKINDIFLKFEPKLKKLIGKYLNSSIHNDIANGTIDNNEKLQTAIDILIGTDDPVFTIDCVFDIFYSYDDKMQEKLQDLLDTGKFDKAIDKFKASSYGNKISEQAINDIVEIIETVAEEGVEAYLVDTSSDITVIEKYKITIDGKEFTLSRALVF